MRSLRSSVFVARVSTLAVIAAVAVVALVSSGAVAPAQAQAKSKLRIVSPTAKAAGPGAAVEVKCSGSGLCIGTLELRFAGRARKAPYSIEGGEKQFLIVPLGSDQRRFTASRSARAITETLQELGDSVRVGRLLRIE